jgi:hypothetical protein
MPLPTVAVPSNHFVVWSDRWLNVQDGENDFIRSWVALTDSNLQVFYNDVDHVPTQVLPLRGLTIKAFPRKFTIWVYDDDAECVIRCGEVLEYNATLEALQRRIDIAKSQCPMCLTLQRELEAAVAALEQLQLSGGGVGASADLSIARHERDEMEVRMDAALRAQARVERELAAVHETCAQVENRRVVADNRAFAAEEKEREAAAKTKFAERQAASVADRLAERDREVSDREAKLAVAKFTAELHTSRQRELHAAKSAAQANDTRAELTSVADELRDERTRAAALSAELHAAAARFSGLQQDLESARQEAASARLRLADAEAAQATAQQAAAAAQVTLSAERRAREAFEQRSSATRLHSEALAAELTTTRSQLATLSGERTQLAAAAAEASALHQTALGHAAQQRRTLEGALAAAHELHQKTTVNLTAALADAQATTERLQAQHTAEMAASSKELLHATQRAAVLQADLKRLTERTFTDAAAGCERGATADTSVNTLAFGEALARAPELATTIAARCGVALARATTAVVGHMQQLSAAALVECQPLVAELRSAILHEVRATQSASLLEAALRDAASTPDGATAAADTHTLPPSRRGRTAAADDAFHSKDEAEILHGLRRVADAALLVEQALRTSDDAGSIQSRSIRIAVTAGYLECVKTFDAVTGALAANHEFRDALMTYLKGPGTSARAAASQVLSGPRGQRNAALEALCNRVNLDFCELFDRVLHESAGRPTSDAQWRRKVTQRTSECLSLAHGLGAKEATDAVIDDYQRKAATIGDAIRALLATDVGPQRTGAVRELVSAHAQLLMAIFVAVRRRNRQWLNHHDAAESIARFGVALKRAGQILEQSKIRGAETYASECLAGWPIVKQLCALPRILSEEDRAFALLWDGLIATSAGVLTVPGAHQTC